MPMRPPQVRAKTPRTTPLFFAARTRNRIHTRRCRFHSIQHQTPERLLRSGLRIACPCPEQSPRRRPVPSDSCSLRGTLFHHSALCSGVHKKFRLLRAPRIPHRPRRHRRPLDRRLGQLVRPGALGHRRGAQPSSTRRNTQTATPNFPPHRPGLWQSLREWRQHQAQRHARSRGGKYEHRWNKRMAVSGRDDQERDGRIG